MIALILRFINHQKLKAMTKFKFLLVATSILFGMSCTNTNRDPYANEIEEDNIIQREITDNPRERNRATDHTLMEQDRTRLDTPEYIWTENERNELYRNLTMTEDQVNRLEAWERETERTTNMERDEQWKRDRDAQLREILSAEQYRKYQEWQQKRSVN